MKNTAAEFIRRAAFVDANALLKDECGVEYKKPSQVQYYALFKDHEALKHVADMLGCMTYIEYQESTSRLTVVGEEMAVGTVRQVWQTALKTYTTTLNEGLTAWHSYAHPRILGLLDGLEYYKKEKNDD